MIVGLGNPGRDYAGSRHNVGFDVVDAFCASHGAAWAVRRDFESEVARVRGPFDADLHALKPLTFMNESGRAAAAFCRFFRIEPGEVIVVHDELNLPVGETKLSVRGGPGGHNGVASLLTHLGDGFKRLRIGIGPRHPPGIDLADYVLGKLTPEQSLILKNNLPSHLAGLELLLRQGVAPAMNRLNRRAQSDDRSNDPKL